MPPIRNHRRRSARLAARRAARHAADTVDETTINDSQSTPIHDTFQDVEVVFPVFIVGSALSAYLDIRIRGRMESRHLQHDILSLLIGSMATLDRFWLGKVCMELYQKHLRDYEESVWSQPRPLSFYPFSEDTQMQVAGRRLMSPADAHIDEEDVDIIIRDIDKQVNLLEHSDNFESEDVLSGNLLCARAKQFLNPDNFEWLYGGLDTIVTELMNTNEQAGRGRRPTGTIRQMIPLPTVHITSKQVEDDVECGVCLSEFSLKETVSQLPCQHYFHEGCILPWVRASPTCPMCRAGLQEQYSDYEPASDTAQPRIKIDGMVLFCF